MEITTRTRSAICASRRRYASTHSSRKRSTSESVFGCGVHISEGYLCTRHGAGTFVGDFLPRSKPKTVSVESVPDPRLRAFWRNQPPLFQSDTLENYRFDFRLGLPDVAAFPFPLWRRLATRSLRTFSKAPAAHASPEGSPALREAITKHISLTRAVACRFDDILVTAGAQQAFDLLARILVTPGQTVVATEEPGYPPVRNAFAAAGAKIISVPVDDEGLLVDRLPSNTNIICTTARHAIGVHRRRAPRAPCTENASNLWRAPRRFATGTGTLW